MSTSDLSAFELYALRWDGRDQAVTASFEGPLDEVARRTWEAPPGHDRVRFHLRFTSARTVRVGSRTSRAGSL